MNIQEKDIILKVENVFHSYGKFQVLMGITLNVKKGGITALIGPNGAGKTTFYNVISGKFPPTKGKIIFNNIDITRLPPHKIVKLKLLRSFQITNIFPDLTVIENIIIPLIIKNNKTFSFFKDLKSYKNFYKRAEEIIDTLGLSDFKNRKVSELAYGDKRLVEIGITFASDPEMVLLDEPTAGMNPSETERTVNLIKELSEKMNVTFFITEHDMNVVFSISEYIFVLHQGTLLAQGTPDEIKNNKAVKEAYLGGSVIC